MAAIQFYGKDAVIKAAENRDCAPWAIFQGRQFLFKCEEQEIGASVAFLEEILQSLSHSTAVYTIKFYEEAKKIKENTPCDGSFNFRLVEEEERAQRQAMYSTGSRAVIERLERIEAQLTEDEEEEDEEPEIGSINGVIAGLIQEPEKLMQLINIGKTLLGIGPKMTNAPGAIAGIPEDQQLAAAIEILKKNDPKIAQHLAKLAHISENNKDTFTYLVGMLDKM